MTFNIWQKMGLCAMLVMIFACASSMWAEDLKNDRDEYCKNVTEHVWPDYKNIFVNECKGWLTQRNKSVN